MDCLLSPSCPSSPANQSAVAATLQPAHSKELANFRHFAYKASRRSRNQWLLSIHLTAESLMPTSLCLPVVLAQASSSCRKYLASTNFCAVSPIGMRREALSRSARIYFGGRSAGLS